jgi:chromosome segregation ATPase
MTNAEIITAIISAIGLIFVLLKGLHELEEDRSERKAFERKATTILDNIQEQYIEIQKQIEASREDRRALDRRISIVEESAKLSHTRIDSLSDKLEALRDKIK